MIDWSKPIEWVDPVDKKHRGAPSLLKIYGDGSALNEWTEGDGSYSAHVYPSNSVFIRNVKPKLLEIWVNEHRDWNGFYKSPEEAERYRAAGCIRTVHLREVEKP